MWDDTIVNGHNRYEICTQFDIPFTTHALDFDSRDDAKAWIIQNQFARRNLTPYQRVELVLKLKPLIAVGQGARTELRPNWDKVDTKSELAKIAGVGHNTIVRGEFIAVKADDSTKAKLRTGETSINAEYTKLRREEKEDQREQRRDENRLIIKASPSPERKPTSYGRSENS